MRGPDSLTAVAAAQEQLRSLVSPTAATESVPLADADGCVLAAAQTADRPVPHYDRAAMDGYAVRAADVHEASERAPVRLSVAAAAGSERAVPVDTGAAMPEAADSVLRVEDAEREGETLTAFTALPPGENVASVGEDVGAGTTLFPAGHQLAPADLGLLRAVGRETVAVYDLPTVAIVPTGEELVASDPAPGETIATNGLTVARYVERWGGRASVADPVADDPAALREAIAARSGEGGPDILVTIGGTSMGERDLVVDTVTECGTVHVHGLALRPGHPAGFGTVAETPVVMLPGYPVGCLVTAMALLGPAVTRRGRLPAADPRTRPATLTRKIASEPGFRTYARVAVDREEATPIRTRGSGVLSSVTDADGWVVVPEVREGIQAGETVSVEAWASPQGVVRGDPATEGHS